MARTRMVTRTIKSTEFKVMCLDVVEGKAYTDTVVLAGTFKTVEDAKKAISAVYDTDVRKAVHIEGFQVNSNLYGMTEDKFIANAEILPDRIVKTDKDNEEE